MALNNSQNTDNTQQNTRPNVVQHPLQNSNIRPRLSTTPSRPLTLEQKIKGQQMSKAYKNYRQNQMSEHNNQDRAETEPIPRTPPIPHSQEGHPVPLAPTTPEVPFIPETRLHVVNNPDPIDVDTARIGQSRYSQLRNQSQYQSRPPMGPRMPENQPNWQPKTEAPNNNQTPENITQNSAEETKHQNIHAEVNEPQQPLYSGPGAELERNRTVYLNRRNGAQDAKFIPNNISGVNRINTYNRPITVSEGSSVRLRPIPEMNSNVNAPNNRRNPRNRPVGQGHGRTSTITNMSDITGTPVQNQTTPNTQNHYTPIDANTRQNNRTPSIQRDNTQQGNTQQQNNTRRPGNSM